MNVAKIYGNPLTDEQIKTLLNGSKVCCTANGYKNIVLPEVIANDYNGKTYYQWKTERG